MRENIESDIQKRIIALSVFYTRAVLETHILLDKDQQMALEENRMAAEGLQEQFQGILQSGGEIFSPKELVLLNMPFESWTEANTNNASWSNEHIGTLKWAIGLQENIPEYDFHYEIFPDLDEVDMDKSKLRNEDDIGREFERGKKWNWRVAAEFLYRNNPEAYKQEGVPGYHQIVTDSANDALARGLVSEIKEDDLIAFGKLVTKLADDELALLGAISYARQKSLAWILGHFDNSIKAWDEIESDTSN